jgi:mono/diheme cytochrome c family protein
MRRLGIELVKSWVVILVVGAWATSTIAAETPPPDEAAAERGRVALTSKSFLSPAWKLDTFEKVTSVWKTLAPNPETDRSAYDRVVYNRYGLHSPPYPNDGLPMGIRRATSRDGKTTGLQLDCMICHGGSIGGTSYVGLGNTQLDLQHFLRDMTLADSGRKIPFLFPLNTSKGTVNAGQIAAVLLAARNTDLTVRRFPLPLAANIPEMDVPAWWLLGRKSTMYSDGRTDARSVRTNMQFLLGELTLDQFKELEPTFADIQAYFKSLKPPKYPFPIDEAKAKSGSLVFNRNCAKCHGTYGPEAAYPDEIVPLELIGTDPARAKGLSSKLVAHYNTMWFAEGFPAEEEIIGYQAPPLDGIWATAPYLHNGSVPTIEHLLKSSSRPARFLRPPSTSLDYYDKDALGWKAAVPEEPIDPITAGSRSLFDSSRFGLGNQGHRFGDKLSDEERSQVIEYLKTL